jgi:prepilin-type N-terminal cleavage/methylation domain-containing protein
MCDHPSGFSLVEVLVSLFILSLILLGLDAMECVALRESHAAYFLNVAAIQMQAMTERLTTLDQAQGLEEQVAIWNSQNNELLPQSKGSLTGKFPVYQLSLSWGANTLCNTVQKGPLTCLSDQLRL